MKTVTIREFYHNPSLVDGLSANEQLVVTANGQPKFVVKKAQGPRMTRALAEQRAVGNPKGRKFDGTSFLASIKK